MDKKGIKPADGRGLVYIALLLSIASLGCLIHVEWKLATHDCQIHHLQEPDPVRTVNPESPSHESKEGAKLIRKLSSIVGQERSHATFTCTARGNPSPIIKWRRPSLSLPSGRFIITNKVTIQKHRDTNSSEAIVTSALRLTGLSTSDNGVYMCQVINKLGKEDSAGFLTVIKPLHFTRTPKSQVKVTSGDHAFLYCAAANAMEVTWNGVRSGRYHVIHPNGTLELPDVTSQDQGMYTCIARNGQQMISATSSRLLVTPPAVIQRWQEYKSYGCNLRRTLLERHVSKEQCKALCTNNCIAVEWWPTGDRFCFKCMDVSSKTRVFQTNPPNLIIKIQIDLNIG